MPETSEDEVLTGSGNVFADLSLPDAEDHALKADLVLRLRDIIAGQGLTQTAAAARMGLKQPNLSRLLAGHFRGVSVTRLLRMLTALGEDVTIQTAPANAAAGQLRLQPREPGACDIAAA